MYEMAVNGRIKVRSKTYRELVQVAGMAMEEKE
jgi:hypothetical protein